MALKIEGRFHLGTMKLSDSTKLEFNVVRHDGKNFIDVRTWFSNIYQGGVWTPTKKGIHFPIEKLDEFKRVLAAGDHFDEQELKPDVD
jgi:hypothetical protein